MAARFPQSESSVAYRIKAAWASKIHAIFWAVAADKVQMLRGSDTASTVISRATSGATFDATNGRIVGNNTTLFAYEQSGGFGTQEKDAYSVGASYYGDGWGATQNAAGAYSAAPPDALSNGFKLFADSAINWSVQDSAGTYAGGTFSDDVASDSVFAMRHDKADATAQIRTWANGSELSSKRVATSSATSTSVIAATGRPLYFGGSSAGTSNSKWDFEACWFATALSDADMATITSDPSSIIEVSSSAAALEGAATASVTATGSLTTSAAVKGVRLTTGQASMTGLRWAWFDSPNPSAWTAPAAKGSGESTDGSAVLEIDITGTGLAVTDWGFLVVQKEGATKEDDVLFAGRLQVISL